MTWFTRLVRLSNDLSPTCKEAARRQSEAMDQRLSSSRRLGLKLHLLLCKWCRRYGKQLKFLRSAAHQCEQHESEAAGASLSPEARERLKAALRSGRE